MSQNSVNSFLKKPMISDILYEAVKDFDWYVKSSVLYQKSNFKKAEWEKLMRCRKEMEETRRMLDRR